MPYTSPVYAPVWTGFYAGVNAGYGWATFDDGVSSDKMSGFLGGGQLGYNWQISSISSSVLRATSSIRRKAHR